MARPGRSVWRAIMMTVVMSLILPVPGAPFVGVAGASGTPACANDGGVAQNDLKVSPGHGQVFYIDTGQGQEVDAAYAGYRIQNTGGASRANVWAKVHTFVGGVVGLADPLTASYRVGDIGASATEAAFFLLKADRPTTTDQTHVISLYDRDPALSGAATLYSCIFTFSEVKETIKAAANKVTDVDVVRVEELGGSVTVTVEGQTGTIGSGRSSPDGEVIWFSPAARSSWPSASLVLESTTILFATNAGLNQNSSTHTDTLVFRDPTTTLTGTKSRYYYRATYVFRVRGPVSGDVQTLPIAQISSGTQIKHTDVGSITSKSASTFAVATPVNVDVTKSASTSIGGSSGAYEFSYTLSLENTSSSAISLDQIVDGADASLTFEASSGSFDGAPLTADPVLSDGSYVFQGPFAIPAGATRTLTYTMTAACASGSTFDYSNTAYGRIGAQVVGESGSTVSGVRVSGTDCGGGTATVEDADAAVDPAAITQAATSVTASGATLNGSVNARGTAGRTIILQYGTAPDLSTLTTVTLDPSTASADFVAVSTALTGLAAGTTYYFRVGIDAVRGEILSFTTSQAAADPTATTDGVSAIVAGSGSDGTATLEGSFDANLVSGGATPGFQWGRTGTAGSETVCTNTSYGSTAAVQEDTDDNGSLDADVVLLGGFPAALSLDVGSLELNSYYCARAVIQWSGGGPAYGDPVLFRVSGTQTITYLANSATGGTAPAADSAATGSTVTVASDSGSLVRTGWTFAGWNTTADGAGTTYAAGSGQFTLTGPVTLYAHWTASVTYDGNTSTSGSAPTDGSAYSAADTVTVAAPGSLAKTSSSFTGWNTVADGSGTDYVAGQTFTLPSSGGVTLYAIWATQRTITYDANGSSSGSAPNDQLVGDGATATLATNTGSLARTGFVFGGWNTAADGSGSNYAEAGTLTVSADVTLYARWLAARTVSYDGNGSTSGSVPTSQTVGDGRTVTVATNSGALARNGYSFDGWQTTTSGGTRYAAGTSSFTVSSDVTLYARWVANGGGSGGSGGSSGSGGSGGSGGDEVDEPDPVVPPEIAPRRPTPRATRPAAAPPAQANDGNGDRPVPPVTAGPGAPSATAPDGPTPGRPEEAPAVRGGLGALVPAPLAPTPPSGPAGSLFGGAGTVDLGDGVRPAGEVSGAAPGVAGAGGRDGAVAEVVRGAGVRSPDDLRGEQLGGFTPGSSTIIRIVGARTGARFVVSDVEQVDRRTLIEAIKRSIPAQASEFFRIAAIDGDGAPPELREWDEFEREAAVELFAASGLDEPRTLGDLRGEDLSDWIPVRANAATYVPGSVVYLTLTSAPIVLAEATVDAAGTADLVGSLPASVLTSGEHRIRLVGIRALDGVSVDDAGDIEISDELMVEIERFDLGTQSTIAIVGENPSGGSHLAVRVVPLVPVAPWWTLLVLAAALVVVTALRRRGSLVTRRGERIARAVMAVAAVPAVVLGWRSTVTVVAWWGLGLGLVAVGLVGRLPAGDPRSDEDEPERPDRVDGIV